MYDIWVIGSILAAGIFLVNFIASAWLLRRFLGAKLPKVISDDCLDTINNAEGFRGKTRILPWLKH